MKARIWLICWLLLITLSLGMIGDWVYRIDPFFHYHKPNLSDYYYVLDNQRSQNDGICRHFDYNAIITGTSMTENFRTTEADELFGCNFIKVAYAGGSYKEINDNIEKALRAKNIRIVIRGLDYNKLLSNVDDMITDPGVYPTYLYDNNVLNDIEYIFNRDVVFGRVYQMTVDKNQEGFLPGITSFDEYSRWQNNYTFGINTVCPNGVELNKTSDDMHLSEEEKSMIVENIRENVTRVPDEFPDTQFFYFYTPYSAAWWCEQYNAGEMYKWLEAERTATEMIISHDNIHLFSFNNLFGLTKDLNNYKDSRHYAAWINSLILKWMHDGTYQITKDNYEEYLKSEQDYYTSFDFMSLNGQEDYEADYYAAALLNKELSGVEPLDVLNTSSVNLELSGAECVSQDGKNSFVDCHGTLERDSTSEDLISYIRDKGYIGVEFLINLDEGYNYLCFKGKKNKDQGRLLACVFGEDGELVGIENIDYLSLDYESHQYVIDLSAVHGNVKVVLNGGYTDNLGSVDSNYQFSDIIMY